MQARLSKREKEVLELSLTAADDKVVAGNCNPMMSPAQVAVHKSNVRRKIKAAKKFLRQMRKYREVLFERKYKGI